MFPRASELVATHHEPLSPDVVLGFSRDAPDAQPHVQRVVAASHRLHTDAVQQVAAALPRGWGEGLPHHASQPELAALSSQLHAGGVNVRFLATVGCHVRHPNLRWVLCGRAAPACVPLTSAA